MGLVLILPLTGLAGETAEAVNDNPCAPAPAAMTPAAAPSGPHFLQLAALDFRQLVPPPPAPDSPEERAELEKVRSVVAARTPADVAWAKVIDTDCVFNLVEVLGPWFTRKNLPQTDAFFQQLNDDVRVIDRASKLPFGRRRPFQVDPSIQPCVRIPTSASYPSGSALQAQLWAELFAEIFPERRAALQARAERAAWGRLVGGVHFPSDLAAGRRLAEPVLAAWRKNAAFQEGFERCRREVIAAAAVANRRTP